MAERTERNLRRVSDLLAEAQRIDASNYEAWRESARLAIEAVYGAGSSQLERFDDIRYTLSMWTDSTPGSAFNRALMAGVDTARQHLEAIRSDLEHALNDPEVASVSPAALHHWVAGHASALWEGGHRRQAVQEAARAVDIQLQLKLGSSASGAGLLTEAFSSKPPKEGTPRLRFAGYVSGSDSWTNAHVGAGQFGAGCMMRIRNLYVHTDEPTDQEALEALSALSLLARWIDDAEVERAGT